MAAVLWDSLLRSQGRGQEGEVGSKACVLSAKVATTFVSRRRGERRWHVDRIFTVLGDMHERQRYGGGIKGFRAQPPGKPVRMRIKMLLFVASTANLLPLNQKHPALHVLLLKDNSKTKRQ